MAFSLARQHHVLCTKNHLYNPMAEPSILLPGCAVGFFSNVAPLRI
jgi:hypothetical protein